MYVLEGEYELGIDDQPTKVFKAGETFYEPTGCLHRVSKNPSAKGQHPPHCGRAASARREGDRRPGEEHEATYGDHVSQAVEPSRRSPPTATERSTMKIVVIGGSGLIGTKLVSILRERGHEVVAASPSSGVNALTGEGLSEALAGAQVVVDVANSPSFEDKAVLEFFETSGRNLLAAEAAAGVRHHVALSVVGTDRLLASGYFRAKMAQEELIKASKIPYTIVRATQFFEFVGAIAQSATDGQTVRLPPALMQPIVSDDVAAALADVALAKPLNGTVELAGPEPIRMDELVRQFLVAIADTRQVITDPQARYFGTAGERSKPHARRKPAHRPHAFRGLAQPLHFAEVTPIEGKTS